MSRDAREQLLIRQAARLERRLAYLQGWIDRLTRLRLGLFLAATAVSLFTLFQAGIWAWAGVSLLSLLPFAAAVGRHRRLQHAFTYLTLWRDLKRLHLARMRLDWAQLPPAASTPDRGEHPFAIDLDLLGSRSLHQLLDTAVSAEGSQRLQRWLLDTAPELPAIRRRQALVQELAARPRFRDRLTLFGTLAADDADAESVTLGHGKWPGQRLIDWLQQPDDAGALRPALLLASLLAAVTLPLLLLNLAGRLPPWWLLTWAPYLLISGSQSQRVAPMFKDASFVADGLRKLRAVFGFLESERYAPGSGLAALCAPFLDWQKRPSAQLRRINRIVAASGIQYNPVLWLLLNALLPWDLFFAYRLIQARAALRQLLPAWLDVWFELEALSALATFAYLNPAAVFPTVSADEPARFQAADLGHPLIPAGQRVCNDFQVDQLGTVFVITGSNMAGKSSFLRALGVALCLAYAGGPVIARQLDVSLFRLVSSIRVTDSVTDGFSFFYAEVRRLQQMLAALQAADPRPLFFLIDEIFRGTNNRERLVGSLAYVRALAGGHGMGAIATHDLELVRLADSIPQIRNVHFRDAVVDGRMVFDYRLRPGPCPTTNALKIMRLAGLPVPDDDAPPAPS